LKVQNYSHTLARQKVMFAYDGGGVEVKAIDFSDSSFAQEWFLNPPSTIRVDLNTNVPGAQWETLINNGQLHYRRVAIPTLAAPPILFGAPIEGTWNLAPFVMRFANNLAHYVTLYDKVNRCFLAMNLETNVMVPNRPDIPNLHFLPYSGNPASLLPTGTGFDINNMRHNLVDAHPTSQIVTSSPTPTVPWNCFFRNDARDSTWVVQMPVYLAYSNNNITGRYFLNPTRCPGINEATIFANPTFLPTPGVFIC